MAAESNDRVDSPEPGQYLVIGGCLDLGISKPENYPATAKMLADQKFDCVVMMEDRQPDFFLTYDGFSPGSYARLNRHGPWGIDSYHPTHEDLRDFVKAIHDAGIDIMYGFWVHENRWVGRRHPELLLIDRDGKQWSTADYSADFNPLQEFQEEDEYFSIKKGDRFADFVCSQYGKLSSDFGFNGLFIGDGGMGYRVFGNNALGLNFYDYSRQTLLRFTLSGFFNCDGHQADSKCLLEETFLVLKNNSDPNPTLTMQFSNDILTFHYRQFIDWNCSEWAGFYEQLGDYLHHERNELLGAYSCMNYSSDKARMHGVDYRAIALAGVDYLVFQSYAHAWGQHFQIPNSDITTNINNMVSVTEQIYSAQPYSKTRILFTAETSDDVEKWRCPLDQTLDQVKAYSCNGPKFGIAAQSEGSEKTSLGRNSSCSDGLFVVWINETPPDSLAQIIQVGRSYDRIRQ